jgi:lipopolysaccharide transport system ATP-binding protein
MMPTIKFDQVSKRYRIGQKLPPLREVFGMGRNAGSENIHWAVKDVSFELLPGEGLGIIGPNGAGKTTILKLLSQITRPTSGHIHVNGRLSALIELGAGFHPDLSGRENIYLNGSILGMHRAEINARFDEIVEFAGIGQYLDTPVKRYSSGMYARLGFAIAAHVDPEVLLIDEVLAVGDYAFQQKCFARMDELRKKGTSLILVVHNMEAVRKVCDRGLVMYRGENIFQGTAADAVIAYSDAVRRAARQAQLNAPSENGMSHRVMTFDAEIEGVTMLDEAGRPATVFSSGGTAVAAVDVVFHKDVEHPVFSLTVRKPDGSMVYDVTTHWLKMQTPSFVAGERCRAEFKLNLPLLDGEYQLGADLFTSSFTHYYDRLERAMGFWVKSSDGAQGLVDLEAKITIHKLDQAEMPA